MGYATTGDIIAYVGRGEKLLSASSPLSVNDIGKIIDDIAFEVDGVLHAIGIPTVSQEDSPFAYGVLRMINAIGAAARVELRLFGEAAPGAHGTTRHEILLAEYHRLLDGIRRGTIRLVDAPEAPLPEDELADSGSIGDIFGRAKRPFFTRTQQF